MLKVILNTKKIQKKWKKNYLFLLFMNWKHIIQIERDPIVLLNIAQSKRETAIERNEADWDSTF